ncbi:MAG: ATP-binding protein [Deltaproteobacteria bacterium]|jgi:chromosomal replication initiator protein|nr:ATP-binding protein [Deltaproteobacteria bacterium]
METTWGKICQKLAINMPEAQYKVWIAPLRASFEGDTLRIIAINDFVARFLRNRFQESILHVAAEELGPELRLEIQAAGPEDLSETAEAAGMIKAGESAGSVDPAGRTSAGEIPEPVKAVAAPASRPSTEQLPSSYVFAAAGPSSRPDDYAASGHSGISESGQGVLPMRWNSQPAVQAARLLRNWRFSFDDFVVGPCNELAHAAARGICNNASVSRGAADLLFLCSSPGLGKTHLMQSVGAGLVQASNLHNPRVEYLSAEDFATQMRMALRCGDIDRFKARYREADVLLLEDVHFLQNKEKTQDEVLGTLTALLDRGSRVVLSSSFALPELRKMDSQLFSRLSSGLIAGIERPDLETRRRIITRKADAQHMSISGDVTEYLAENINADVRQLESCLRNLALKTALLNRGVSLDMAREVVGNYLGSDRALSFSGIVRMVCEGFGLTSEQLNSKSRKQEYVQARNAVFYLARKHTDLSLQEIGKRFNRTHSTVIKGITSVELEISRQSSSGRQLAGAIANIERQANHSVSLH